jgi:hypothetical protein
VLAGARLQGPPVIVGLPVLLFCAVKSAYDLTLEAIFRRMQLVDTREHEGNDALAGSLSLAQGTAAWWPSLVGCSPWTTADGTKGTEA